jgi:hypothetical protein
MQQIADWLQKVGLVSGNTLNALPRTTLLFCPARRFVRATQGSALCAQDADPCFVHKAFLVLVCASKKISLHDD